MSDHTQAQALAANGYSDPPTEAETALALRQLKRYQKVKSANDTQLEAIGNAIYNSTSRDGIDSIIDGILGAS